MKSPPKRRLFNLNVTSYYGLAAGASAEGAAGGVTGGVVTSGAGASITGAGRVVLFCTTCGLSGVITKLPLKKNNAPIKRIAAAMAIAMPEELSPDWFTWTSVSFSNFVIISPFITALTQKLPPDVFVPNENNP